MVTFRFYVVSTVAFFLALAVGVVVGSALDEQLVTGLRDRVETVQQNLDDTVETIDDKNAEIGALEAYVDESAPWAVSDALAGRQTLLVAEDGVDAGTVEALATHLRQGGATLDAIVWLEPRMALAEESDRAALAEALGVPVGDADDLRQRVGEALAVPVEVPDAPDASSTTTTTTSADVGPTTTTPPTTVEVLRALEEAGFVRIQQLEQSEDPSEATITGAAFLGVTGTDSDLVDPGALVIDLAAAQTAVGIPSAVAEAFVEREGIERGDLLTPLREDPALGAEVASVDDLELTQGRVAAVLALARASDGVVGHYGYGDDATAVVPPWPGP